MMLNLIVQELWTHFKGQLVEKLSPPPEETEEQVKLQKIQEILQGFAPRYYGFINVAEMYDPIHEVLGTRPHTEDDMEEYWAIRKGGNHIPDHIIAHVSEVLGKEWVYPELAAAFHLYYHKNLPETGKYRRVASWHTAAKDDIAFFDGRRNFGDGAMGLVVSDDGHELRIYTPTGHEAWSKSGLLGYMRPTDPKVG
jgi:hypothetical protein